MLLDGSAEQKLCLRGVHGRVEVWAGESGSIAVVVERSVGNWEDDRVGPVRRRK